MTFDNNIKELAGIYHKSVKNWLKFTKNQIRGKRESIAKKLVEFLGWIIRIRKKGVQNFWP